MMESFQLRRKDKKKEISSEGGWDQEKYKSKKKYGS